jgi:DNA-binding NtrC family response regulator
MKKVPSRLSPEDATVVAAPRLEMLRGTLYLASRPTQRLVIGPDAILLGRHEDCQLVLDDPRVSSVHAELVATEQGVRLRDKGSKNGTFLGGVRIGEVYLTHRTAFRVAATEVIFEPAAREPVPIAQVGRFGPLVGETPAMRALFDRLKRVAATELTVLIGGETGTGKELVARAIHQASPRKDGPIVIVDCGAIPPSLAEATLFGHEKGAFTGAIDRRISPFVEADGGTIFLDELGEFPIDLQPKLLRVLAERRIKSVGSNTYRPVNVRVVAATRRDLAREVNEGLFRSDLFFRVAEVRVDLPALRARLDDIPSLVRNMLTELGAPDAFERVPASALARLQRYDWPGNVRELRNAVSAALALADEGGPIEVDAHLGSLALPTPPPNLGSDAGGSVTFRDAKQEVLNRFEQDYFTRLYQETGGNISEMARRADVERAHVRMYLRRHGIVSPKSSALPRAAALQLLDRVAQVRRGGQVRLLERLQRGHLGLDQQLGAPRRGRRRAQQGLAHFRAPPRQDRRRVLGRPRGEHPGERQVQVSTHRKFHTPTALPGQRLAFPGGRG